MKCLIVEDGQQRQTFCRNRKAWTHFLVQTKIYLLRRWNLVLPFFVSKIHHCRRTAVQRLVGPVMVIKFEIPT